MNNYAVQIVLRLVGVTICTVLFCKDKCRPPPGSLHIVGDLYVLTTYTLPAGPLYVRNSLSGLPGF